MHRDFVYHQDAGWRYVAMRRCGLQRANSFVGGATTALMPQVDPSYAYWDWTSFAASGLYLAVPEQCLVLLAFHDYWHR
jgi:hypothetical protein